MNRPEYSSVRGDVERAVSAALRAAGYDPLAFRCTALVDGIDGDSAPFLTALTTTGDVEDARHIAADLIKKFAYSPLAEIEDSP